MILGKTIRTLASGLLAACQLLAVAGTAEALSLTNGPLFVDIRTDNGAIDTLTFGPDFYNPGTPVSDWGLQVNTDTSTFRYNNTSGSTQIPVSVAAGGGGIEVSGTYTQGGVNIAFLRTYKLVGSLNTLNVTTTFTNNGAPTTLSYFDTFDPDQGTPLGYGAYTYNDAFTNGAILVGQAYIDTDLTVAMGTDDPAATVASGGPFQINDGSLLNSFFASPADGGGALEDEGLHVGFRFSLAAGATRTVSYNQAYGSTPAEANGDLMGSFCDISSPDADSDGVCDTADNCVSVANPGQEDSDLDRVGNACNDADDSDGDEWSNVLDNCPAVVNAGQEDTCEASEEGDACDVDPDGDLVFDACDNCPLVSNAGQEDANGNSTGDACETQGRLDNAGCYSVADTMSGGGPAYSYVDVSGSGTLIPIGSHTVSGAIPIGFDFDFYATTYTQLYVSSNGFLTFLSGQGEACCGFDIPLNTTPGALIAGLWAHLHPAGSNVYYATVGSAPSRRFVLQFKNVTDVDTGDLQNWEIILEEATGEVLVQYQDATGVPESSAGIQNEDGTIGLRWAGPGSVSLSSDAVLYSPAADLTDDDDSDGVVNCLDNCPTIANPGQEDTDGDRIGDACMPVVVINSVVEDGGTPLEVDASVSSPIDSPLSGSIFVFDAADAISDLTFHWLATDCGTESSLRFLVNGAEVAAVDPDPANSCDCFPGIQSLTIPVGTVLAHLVGGANELGVRKTGGVSDYLAWVSASVTIGGTTTEVGVFDEPGGTEPSYGNPDACDSGLTEADLDETASTPEINTAASTTWTGQLPCGLDLTGLGAGSYVLVITATDEDLDVTASDSAPFTLSSESVMSINAGAVCNDGNACTTVDTCVAGGCLGSVPLACDDSDGCTVNTCSPATGCVYLDEPEPTCLDAGAASLMVKDSTDPAKAQIRWKWGGPEVLQAAFGTPDTSTGYTLCVYDSTGGDAALSTRLDIGAGPGWTNKDPKGWLYKDKTASSSGVSKVQLKPGIAGKSRAQVQAKGIHLPMPAPFSGTEFFDQGPSVTVQLVNDATSVCWKSSFATAQKNTATLFKAKLP